MRINLTIEEEDIERIVKALDTQYAYTQSRQFEDKDRMGHLDVQSPTDPGARPAASEPATWRDGRETAKWEMSNSAGPVTSQQNPSAR
jgi:hypothetical protein